MELILSGDDAQPHDPYAEPLATADLSNDNPLTWKVDRYSKDDPGRLYLASKGHPPRGSEDHWYEVIFEPTDVGIILAAVPQAAIEDVVRAFLRLARPEVVGGVTGLLADHLARQATGQAPPAGKGSAPVRAD
jgi:hypothetical protein